MISRTMNLIFSEEEFEALKRARELDEKKRKILFRKWEDFVFTKCLKR